MEIVKVDFASCLKLVGKIEKSESKRGTRPGPGGRKPPNAEELDSLTDRPSRTAIVTKTIPYTHGVYA